MEVKTKKSYYALLLFLVSSFMFSQQSYWEKLTFKDGTNNVSLKNCNKNNYKIYQLNLTSLKQQLINAPLREISSGKSNTIVNFPDEKGNIKKYRIVEAPVLSDEISNRYPNIKTYLGADINNPSGRIRFSITPLGFKAMISYPDKAPVFIQPVTKNSNNKYLVYNRNISTEASNQTFKCLQEDDNIPEKIINTTKVKDGADDQLLRTYRLAISTTGEFTNFWDDGDAGNGNAQDDALAQVVSIINRVNEIFEIDMAITFNLVTDTKIIYPDANSDPYNDDYSEKLQETLTSEIGAANYDIGHLFVYDQQPSGFAGCIGCVCEDSNKGSAYSIHKFVVETTGPFYEDFYDSYLVPHEMGHQMGAHHTLSNRSEGSGVNVEPGSGSTLMGYAGISGDDDVQDYGNPYFHHVSINEIMIDVNTSANNCAVTTTITNKPPVANAGSDYTIPKGTAFILKASATDPDEGDKLTYCWEQIDDGITTKSTFSPTKTDGALWRSRPPSSSPNRYMPIMSRVLAGELTESNPVKTDDHTSWETVSTVARTLNFGLTVRDRSLANGGGQMPQSDLDKMIVTVSGNIGPFKVTSQTSNETWIVGNDQTITWDVAGTDGGAVNTPTVNILLSTDGGQTFPYTLASNVPNDGSESVSVPTGTATTNARVIVEGNNHIFYAVNASDFTIDNPLGLEDFDSNIEFVVNPNPNNGTFNIKLNGKLENDIAISIYDVRGRNIYSKKHKNESNTFNTIINLKNVQSGLYLLKVSNGNKLANKKILIK